MSVTEYAIGRHCGVTFAGLKIASLVNLPKGDEDVITMLARRFAGKGFLFELLRESEVRSLVYVCHQMRLEQYLTRPEVKNFLSSFGYEYATAADALEQLKDRMSGEFPHEIGIFLGYPLCDVRGLVFCAIRTDVFCAANGRYTQMRTKRCAPLRGFAGATLASVGIWTEGERSLKYSM